MSQRVYKKSLVGMASLLAALLLVCTPAAAQCPLCRLAIENSSQAALMSRGLNLGILVLLIPPVTIFCFIFYLALKHSKFRES